jgi:hypothetical protein
VVLTLLAILVAALAGLAIASVVAPRWVVTLGTAGICGLGVLLVLASLLAREQATMLALPIGPPGGTARLALGAAFLLLLFVAVIPAPSIASCSARNRVVCRPNLPASRRRWLRWL